MSIEISPETEARLADEAKRRGVSIDVLLQLFLHERAVLPHPAQSKGNLPVWHLGGAGYLHRREIYDDAR
jgi:hypothetical protein